MVVGLVALGVAGCGAFKKPKTPAEQARAALATDGKDGAWVGHVDGGLAPVSGKDVAFSGQSEVGLHWIGIVEGHLCFAMEFRQQLITETLKEVGEGLLQLVRKVSFTFEARDALDYPAQAAWPGQPTNQVQVVEMVKNERSTKVHTRSDHTTWTSDHSFTRIELCGPLPKLARTTKFVTITRFNPPAQDSVPALYIWKVDEPVYESLLSEAPAASTPPSYPPTEPANPAPSSDDLTVRITKDGRFTIFLKLLAASDYADKLADGKGTYTLFLPTDDVLARIDTKKWLAAPKTLNRAVHAHIFGGASTKTKITDGISSKDGYGTLQNENGDYVKVTVDSGTLHIGKATVVGPELAASNGIIYVIDSSLY